MVYKYKKLYRIRKKKSILKNRFFRTAVLIIVVIGGISYFLFFSGIFKIEKIIITGEEKISKENIKALIPRKNIFLIDLRKIKNDILSNFLQISSVEIRRSFPDILNVLIAERSAQALWCEEEKCFLIDNEGVIFGEPQLETFLIKITGRKELLNKEKISKILEIQGKLKEGFVATTTKAIIVSEERLNMKTSEGWEIYFNLKGDLGWQLQELVLVLEKQINPVKRRSLEYIDLRFSRVYYK